MMKLLTHCWLLALTLHVANCQFGNGGWPFGNNNNNDDDDDGNGGGWPFFGGGGGNGNNGMSDWLGGMNVRKIYIHVHCAYMKVFLIKNI